MIDYYVAAFHRYDMHKSVYIRTTLGKKIDRLMRSAAVVVAGNDYLAGRACEAGAKQLEVVPSVVDLGRYELKDWEENDAILRAGWIGTPQTIKYLLEIEGVIRALADEDISFILIGAEVPPQFAGLPVESKKWSLESEVQAIRELDVGIMPLADLPFERGKCGYKLIQYMACGLPVVASPVGLNHQIVHHGENGFLADAQSAAGLFRA